MYNFKFRQGLWESGTLLPRKSYMSFYLLFLCLINYFCHVIGMISLWLHIEYVRSFFDTVMIIPPGRQKYTRKMVVVFVSSYDVGRITLTNGERRCFIFLSLPLLMTNQMYITFTDRTLKLL